jgi:YhcN/YlaJ family sporulation lipoprotein
MIKNLVLRRIIFEVILLKKTLSLKKTVSLFLCFCFIVLSGCASRNPQYPNQNTNTQGQNMMGGTNPNTGYSNMSGTGTNPSQSVNPSNNMPIQPSIQGQTNFDRQRAENIRKQLAAIPGVKQANVLVNGNTTIVGYSTTDPTKDTTALRDTVSRKIKQVDAALTDIAVSSSPDIMARTTQLGNDITNNKPIQELRTSYDKLMMNVKSLIR